MQKYSHIQNSEQLSPPTVNMRRDNQKECKQFNRKGSARENLPVNNQEKLIQKMKGHLIICWLYDEQFKLNKKGCYLFATHTALLKSYYIFIIDLI